MIAADWTLGPGKRGGELRIWVRIAPPADACADPGLWLVADLRRRRFLPDKLRPAHNGPATPEALEAFDRLRRETSHCVAWRHVEAGEIRTPGKRERRAALDALQRALGPGRAAPWSAVLEVAAAIVQAKVEAARAGRGTPRDADLARVAAAEAIARARARQA